MTTVQARDLTAAEHLTIANTRALQADDAYTQAETVRNRGLAWKWRRSAEQLTADANRHYALAGA